MGAWHILMQTEIMQKTSSQCSCDPIMSNQISNNLLISTKEIKIIFKW